MTFAVIVTYNRKVLLEKSIRMLLRQTRPFDRIIIVDNHSVDGTQDMLRQKGWITSPFQYIYTQKNIGGAGGFCLGIKTAYEEGADWIVLMDDDGCPADENTFSELMNTADQMLRTNTCDGKLFINCLVAESSLLSFKLGKLYTVEEAIRAEKNGIIPNEANPFNGTAISRKLVDAIGFPNADFFIKGDEVDYKLRASDAGAFICTVINARFNHPRPETKEKTVLGVKVPFSVEAPWKEYYTARNFTYMYKQKKQYKAIAFEIIFVKLLAVLQTKCNKYLTIRMMLKGVADGWMGKMGPRILP